MDWSEDQVLSLLATHTYEDVEAQTGWSRGRIWRLAVKAKARKTEEAIQQRAQRHRAQEQLLTDLISLSSRVTMTDVSRSSIPMDSAVESNGRHCSKEELPAVERATYSAQKA